MAKISVIIPIYNLEQYVEKCVASCTSQTFRDLEIICVNDGSTDQSSNILARLAASDPRIQITDTANNGVVCARETGIAKACGTYLTFLDGDDYLATDALEKLYDLAISQNADIVNGTIVKIMSERKELLVRQNSFRDSIDFIKHAFRNEDFYLHARLFKRHLFEQRRLFCPSKITYNEDVILVLSLALAAKTIVSHSDETYFYLFGNSSSATFSGTQYGHVIEVRKMIFRFFKETGLSDCCKSELLSFIMAATYNILRYCREKILLHDDLKVLSVKNLFWGDVRKILKKHLSGRDYCLLFPVCLCPRLSSKLINLARKLNS